MTETDNVRERYARREEQNADSRYDPLEMAQCLTLQEKERALIRWIRTCQMDPLHNKTVLEIGCGKGDNLLQLIRLGFQPENIVGNELLEERARLARHRLPEATRILAEDASTLDLPDASFDIVFQSTVFTSLLDDAFQQRLADRMWTLSKPGGGILWYDFIYNNPRNPDVRGVPVHRIRTLFPQGTLHCWRLTLAPPISRRVTRLHPALYNLYNALPFLRTHVLCWIAR